MEFFNGSVQANIEDAIINAFFEAELMSTKPVQFFKLDERNFQSHFKKRIVERINERLSDNGSISLLAYEIAEKCKGSHEQEMLMITAQSALPKEIARENHTNKAKKRIERSLNVA